MRNSRRPSGFSYIGLLIVVAVIALASSASLTMGQVVAQRSEEEELLFIGNQFRMAIQSYVGMGARYPGSLEELLEDTRFPVPVRHLRRIYADPMTRRQDWQLLYAPTGGIMGIASRSERHPLKKRNFADADKGLEDKASYSEWLFYFSTYPGVIVPSTTVPVSGAAS